MTLNTLAYCLYILFTCTVILRVGWFCFQHGKYYLLEVFQGNYKLAQTTNKLLLVGYYLLNIGYALLTLSFWEEILSITQLLGSLGEKLGFIVLSLGLAHFTNIYGTRILYKYLNQTNT